MLEEEEETYGRPYYDLDNVDDREACEQILTLLAGPAASYVKTGSFLDLKKYFDEILIRSGGEEDAFTLDKSLAFSRKYHNRADEITRKFFNLLVEFFSDDDIKPAMNVLGSEIAIHGGIERDDLSKYVKGITGKSLSVIGSEIDTYFKINSRFEKMITKGKAILTSIH